MAGRGAMLSRKVSVAKTAISNPKKAFAHEHAKSPNGSEWRAEYGRDARKGGHSSHRAIFDAKL
jgi:hypothetical protein